jgi:hypothetical protein
MARFEILVELNGQKYQLDTYKTDPISLTYNVADVADISARNAAFSKTIKLPETKNNRAIFDDISDLGIDSSFNPNKKTKAWILVDTAIVFEGFLQLRKVFLDKSQDSAEYEVVIYADNDNFFKQLGDSFLTDIDFSELNHDWTAQNVRSSWTASYAAGYYYPLIDYGRDWTLGDINGWTQSYNTRVRTRDMFPATNVKYILDKIFGTTNFTYQSNFLNSDQFTALYIPFNREKIIRNIETAENRLAVSRSTVATYSSTQSIFVPRLTVTYNAGSSGPQGQNQITVANQVWGAELWKGKIPFNYESSPYGDPNNLWNTTTYEYTAPVDVPGQKFVCNFDITFNYRTNLAEYDLNLPITNNIPGNYIVFRRSRNPQTGATVSGGTIIPVNGSQAYLKFTPTAIPGLQYGTNNRVYGQISTDMLDQETGIKRKLYPGEKVWVEVRYSTSSQLLVNSGQTSQPNPPDYILPSGKLLLSFNTPNTFFNIISETVQTGETIEYNNIIPKNVKQKDFITSLIKMFNLYIEPSKDFDNVLYIEPRDDYYAAGKIKDWTQKLDISQDIQEQILAETQNRQTTFKYKDDKDYYNEAYKEAAGGVSYGEYRYFFENEFITGEKKVEIIFSPTPVVLVPNSQQLVIPKIGKLNNNVFSPTDHNVRILTRFNSSTNSTWTYGDYEFMNGGTYNAYTVLTSNGFGNQLHPFQVGDYVRVNQVDGGALKPMLQGDFKIVGIRDTKSIIINIPFSQVGSGAAVGGTVTPIDGLLPTYTDNDAWNFEGTSYKAYPYLGHFNNPQNPSYDINFGQTTGLYYEELTVTNNNLVSIYWQNYLNELSDRTSRIITANFYLTAFDIADFRFNNNIFINGQYYKVNKIIGYDPTQEKLTKVELIKTLYITIPRRFSRFSLPYAQNNTIAQSVKDTTKPTGGIIGGVSGAVGSGTIIKGNKQVVVGSNNQVYGSKLSVIGDDNQVAGEKNQIIGDSNTLQGDNSGIIMIGDGNTILPGVKNSFVFGSNLTISESNVFVSSLPIVAMANLVDASRNEVLNPFPDNKIINYVSASRNAVREFVGDDIVNELQGGRYDATT